MIGSLNSRRCSQLRGMALVPTLLIIAMITIIVVLFFNLSSVQLRTSGSHIASVELNSLRDSAINTVIAQLRQGTTEPDMVWTSQPGAVRTFGAATGTATRVYKLYSNKDMTVQAASLTSAADRNLETDVPADWNTKPDVYADLNQPTIEPTGRLNFPIIDPRLMDQAAPSYPGSMTPEGFSYSNTTAAGKTTVTGVILPGAAPTSQRLPMPVQWLYVLEDGSLGVIDKGSREFIPFAGQNAASLANPIVGRMAFWTDDETTKINLNTASEGIYWDTPRCSTNQEIAFAKQPPVRNEVQRFGGHPATTCLSTVFFPGERLLPGQGASDTRLSQIYAVTPRVSNVDATTNLAGAMGGNLKAVAFDSDRLYASVDEFLLVAPDKNATLSPGAAYTRTAVQQLIAGDLDRLARLRFLLTAESRAPETTAAGTPRVSLWPVHYNFTATNTRTSFDNVSAFCTTLGNEVGKIQPFHFRRNSSLTNEGEFTNDSQFSVAASDDPWKIGTKCNGDLATYVFEQLKLKKQGYSASLAEKYDDLYGSPSTRLHNSGTGVMEMMEYLRQTNLHDTSVATGGSKISPYGGIGSTWIGSDISGQVNAIQIGRYPPVFNQANTVLKRPTNQLFTNGLGREYTVSEFGLVFSLAAEHRANGTKYNIPLVDKLKLPKGVKAIQVSPVFEAFCPGQGYTMIAPSSSAKAAYLDKIRIKSTDLGTRAPGGIIVNETTMEQDADAQWKAYGNFNISVAHLAYLSGGNYPSTTAAKQSKGTWWVGWGGSGGRWMYADNNSTGGSGAAGVIDLDSEEHTYPNQYSRGYYLVSSYDTEMTVLFDRATDTRAANARGTFEVAIGNQRDGDFAGHRLYAEVPEAGIVVPVPTSPAKLLPTIGRRLKESQNSGDNRYRNPSSVVAGAETIDANDVVRTWVVRHSDYRLCYIRQTEGTDLPINERLFVPHPGWTPAATQVHSFTKSGGAWEANAVKPTRGIVNGVAYPESVLPDFILDPAQPDYSANKPSSYPYSLDPTFTRDWDNGTGIAPDGAYWNKPDDVAKAWDGTIPPYFQTKNWDGVNVAATNDTTAPNQLMPSAVMFGSLPSAASTGLQWTTYLFRPDITPGGHLGAKDHSTSGSLAGAPPDHVVLDWFWMPVVQPYAISEPFSTAGKINMNYWIAPFTHITRATGMHAVLKSEQILAIPTNAGPTYKDYASATSNGDTTIAGNRGWRHFIDAKKTLLQWEDKFNAGTVFMNAGEICEQFLVPEGEASSATNASSVRSTMQNFWDTHRLTGDNSLERPYANLYPRLTTRSNTFRVHFLVQTLTKARSTQPTRFDPQKDTVTGTTQGDALIERSIDPNDPSLSTSDYNYIGKALSSSLSTAKSLDGLYTWRIRSVRRFTR
jgi:uncharacterized protein (TIGR02600 family)